MSDRFINVHVYDGKLKGLFKAKNIHTVEEKKKIISSVIPKLKLPHSKIMVQTILADLHKHKGANYQIENNVDSSDILTDLIYHIKNPDLLHLLDEQLSDIRKLGTCPSGRVTRLLQLWLAFVDF